METDTFGFIVFLLLYFALIVAVFLQNTKVLDKKCICISKTINYIWKLSVKALASVSDFRNVFQDNDIHWYLFVHALGDVHIEQFNLPII